LNAGARIQRQDIGYTKSKVPRNIPSEIVDERSDCNLDEDRRSSTKPFVRGTP